MGWVKDGCTVTVDWHVFAGGVWRVETLPVGSTAPVNVCVTESRMAPVVYRHQSGECRGECVLPCGHTLTYGCDCDTIALEACQGDDDSTVIEVIGCTREGYVSADVADALIASYENNAYDRNRYEVRRSWDRVSYSVAIAVRGRVLPFAAYVVPLV